MEVRIPETPAHLTLDLDYILSAILQVQLQTILINSCIAWVSFHNLRASRARLRLEETDRDLNGDLYDIYDIYEIYEIYDF